MGVDLLFSLLRCEWIERSKTHPKSHSTKSQSHSQESSKDMGTFSMFLLFIEKLDTPTTTPEPFPKQYSKLLAILSC